MQSTSLQVVTDTLEDMSLILKRQKKKRSGIVNRGLTLQGVYFMPQVKGFILVLMTFMQKRITRIYFVERSVTTVLLILRWVVPEGLSIGFRTAGLLRLNAGVVETERQI